MKKTYKNIGKCIFCKRSEPEVSFRTRPHTIPQTMSGRSIGVDVCDECNHYFGTVDVQIQPHMAVETCVKEILNVTQYLTEMTKAQSEGKELPYLKSIYFAIFQKEHVIRFKRAFASTPSFVRTYTRCFKRGLYEIFLQEFHRQTGRGLEPQFDAIRRFARYNEGDIPVWHMQYNRIGVHFGFDESKGLAIYITHEAINDIEEYGMFAMLIRGFWFYLVVAPKSMPSYLAYLKRENDELASGAIFRGVELLEDIHQIDFTLSRFS